MAKRPIIYTDEIPRDYDHLKGWRWGELERGLDRLAVLGGYGAGPTSGGVVTAPGGFGLHALVATGQLSDSGGFTMPSGNVGGAGGTSATSPRLKYLLAGGALHTLVVSGGNLTIPIDETQVYLLSPVDATAAPTGAGAVQQTPLIPTQSTGVAYSDVAGANDGMGEGATDLTQVLACCTADAASLTNTDGGTVGGSSGPTISEPVSGYTAFLVYAYPVGSDMTDPDDPNLQTEATEALIPYYNPNNPGTPYAGPGGNGIPQATLRAKTASICVRAGTNQSTLAAAVAALTTPAGTVPMYVVVIQSTGALTVFAPGRGADGTANPMGDGTVAPWLSGYLQQHHLGLPGTAPKIDGAVEWAPQATVNNDTHGDGTGTFQSIVAAANYSAVVSAYGAASACVVASQHVAAATGTWAPTIAASSGLPAGSTLSLSAAPYDQYKVATGARDERLISGVIHINYSAATSIPVGTGVKLTGSAPGGAFHAGLFAAFGTAGTVHTSATISDGADTGQPFVLFAQVNSNGSVTVYVLAMEATGSLTDFYIPFTLVLVGN